MKNKSPSILKHNSNPIGTTNMHQHNRSPQNSKLISITHIYHVYAVFQIIINMQMPTILLYSLTYLSINIQITIIEPIIFIHVRSKLKIQVALLGPWWQTNLCVVTGATASVDSSQWLLVTQKSLPLFQDLNRWKNLFIY